MSLKILTYSFYILFFFTPLFFLPFTNELFEYNKMMLVYILTVVIVGTWLFKMLKERSLILKSTPLDIPLMLFLLSQFLSTIFSIDPHTSWWGYYSRSNGGLFSIISYILLFYALVSNFGKEDDLKFLKATLLGGLLVSLYAIPEHFGVSPSCILLTGEVTASCWVQDVQARVFATLGQPNWLAAYLGMLIFPALYFVLTAKNRLSAIHYSLLTILLYMAFTFTYSRGATLGLLAGLVVFILGYLLSSIKSRSITTFGMTQIKPLLVIFLIFILINLFFGSALTGDFRLLKTSTPLARPSLVGAGGGTQLENGGTESGQIRLIVWQGALEIFKHYPLFGSGVETFAYSYYNHRPIAHNFVSEWDFLYNKAHNEYLNYLATTGLFGFLTYMGLILTFLVWSIKYIVYRKNKDPQNTQYSILYTSLLAGYICYLVQNIFGFSVVIIAVLFFIFPAWAFIFTDSTKNFSAKDNFVLSKLQFIPNIIYKRSLYLKIVQIILLLIILYLLFSLTKYWLADRYYKLGQDHSETDPSRAYEGLTLATTLNNSEPLYHAELGLTDSVLATGLIEQHATDSADFTLLALAETNQALETSPKNLSILRTAIRTFYQLSTIDPSFEQKTLEITDQAIKLAPTDPKLYYNKALILDQFNKTSEAQVALLKALELKPDYREAHLTLGQVYSKLGQKQQAINQINNVLKKNPQDLEALQILEEVSSSSGETRQ